MHLVLLDRFNELESPLHRLDARARMLGVGALVLFLSLSSAGLALKLPAVAVFLLALLWASRVPPGYCLKRACLVLPFCFAPVAAALLGGWLPSVDSARWISPAGAAAVVAKAYLSALAVLLLLATTRLAEILKALEWFRVPAPFLLIVHFVYRYLFVLSEEAQHMGYARRSRGAGGSRRALIRALAGSIAVLFARSYARAERIHYAMLARGFNGRLPVRRPFRWAARDAAFAALTAGYLAAVHAAAVYLL